MTTLPRPSLIRSLTFWGGVLAVVFTLWAWQDSARNWSTVGGGPLSITSKSCGISIFHPARPALLPALVRRNEVIIGRMDPRFGELDSLRFGQPDFGGYLDLETRRQLAYTGMLDGRRPDAVIRYYYAAPEDIYPGEWLLFVPYWCVLLGVVGVWVGLIYWRSRRLRRRLCSDVKDEAAFGCEDRMAES
ncbi:hypothetical protein [Haloferula sp. BvORR071]|uniref:hypothetical protein n=1 Tax=Haloferula sp. BvORR071 TaxID=1396141 RepID=UPI000557CD1C|nr:hypothetical protein [Haloferula sp. BvORR071]